MRKPVYSALAAALVVGASGRRGAEGGMPQLNFHDFAPQLVWLVITFVVLYLVMSRLAVPAISDTLEKRQGKIQGDLDAAEKASEDTRALVAAYEKRLADAREEARRLQRERGEADSAAAAAHLTELADAGRADRRGREAHRRPARPGDGRPRGHGARHRGRRLQPSSPASRPTRARSRAKVAAATREATDGYRMGRRQGRANGRRGRRPRHLRRSRDLGRVAFVLFVVLLGKILWTKVTELLDKRAAAIAKALADAERLRDEALAAKAEAEKTLAQATAEAEGILSQAREEAPAHAGPRRDQPAERRRAARAAGARPHRPVRSRRRPSRCATPPSTWRSSPPARCCASRSARAKRRPWSTRRSPSCRAACTDFRDWIARTKKIAGYLWPPPQGGGFFFV